MPKRTLKMNKKPVREGAMQVQMTPQPGSTGGNPATVNVDANDPAHAMQQAQQQMPGQKPAQAIVTSKASGTVPPPITNAPGTSNSPYAGAPAAQLTPESTEMQRLKYPYGIVVPRQFEDVIRKAVISNRKTIPGIVLGESHARIHLRIESAAAMAAFVSRLGKSRDRNAQTILEGIKASV